MASSEKNPFAGCLYFTANAVARHVTRLAEEAFAPTGLCPSGALLLSLVVDRPGLAPSDAAELLHLAPSSVTRFADDLERKGLVRRERQGRQVLLHATAQGRKLLPAVQKAGDVLYDAYTSLVGKTRGRELANELAAISELFEPA